MGHAKFDPENIRSCKIALLSDLNIVGPDPLYVKIDR